MIEERYCSREVSMLLREKGFRECCRYCYGTAVRHNGEDIDEDEEFELKSEGRADEIEYIKGGILHNLYCDNAESFGKDLCAAPTHQMACDWLGDIHDLHIIAYPYKRGNSKGWCCYVYKTYNLLGQERYVNETCNSCYEAIEAALKYSLENLV